MPFGRSYYPITIVRGYPREIYATMFDVADDPVETPGWGAEGWLDYGGTIVPLTGDSALSINSAGVITGTIQAAITADLPLGQLTELTIKAALNDTVEPWIGVWLVNAMDAP